MTKTDDLLAYGLINPSAPSGMVDFVLDQNRVTLPCNHVLTNDNTFLSSFGLKNKQANYIPCN